MQRFNLYQEDYHPSPLLNIWIEFRRSHIALAGFALLVLFVLMSALAPLLAPYSPHLQNTNAILLPPVWEPNGTITHFLGTDSLGRDVFSRLLYACRTTFGSSLIVVLGAVTIGTGVGALAGLLSGVRSSIVNHLFDSIMSVPTLLVAIILVAIFGTGLFNSMLAISLALVPQFVHQTRTFVRNELQKDYVLLDKLDGASSRRIFVFSVLPGMVELIVVQATIALSIAILDISALGFLNLGAQDGTIELGSMISSSLDAAYVSPWLIILPGLCIFLLVLSVNVVGEGVRSALRNRLHH